MYKYYYQYFAEILLAESKTGKCFISKGLYIFDRFNLKNFYSFFFKDMILCSVFQLACYNGVSATDFDGKRHGLNFQISAIYH
ncbi:hypothetical protein A8C56_13625 [Niabella ginsenosidivorans]|uniref:Uncharacterized protein n=1 Tax=Niabella ginsenosidivorans TaxID=1176587 RepID=A0A1A9I5N8_9BACT|nr:hypothetical protein A8C56_13625 [Niabella ginsenosidivorans]